MGYNSAHYDINLINQYQITLLMEDKRSKVPAFLTEDNVLEEHYPEDFELHQGIKYPEYEAEVRDFSEISVIKQGASCARLAVGNKLLLLDIY